MKPGVGGAGEWLIFGEPAWGETIQGNVVRLGSRWKQPRAYGGRSYNCTRAAISAKDPAEHALAWARICHKVEWGVDRMDGFLRTVSATMIAFEIVILLTGVIWRYALDRPLLWTSEVSELVFLWLGMIGTATALQKQEHLRLTAIVARMPADTRLVTALISELVTLGFLMSLIIPAIDHMKDESKTFSLILGLSNEWRAAGILFGLILLSVISSARLITLGFANAKKLLMAVVLVVALAAGVLGTTAIVGEQWQIVVFFVGVAGGCIMLGVPIAFAFGTAAVSYIVWTSDIPMSIMVERIEAGMSHSILLAVPMFIALGLMIEMTGMARALVSFLVSLVGRFKGGLSFVLLMSIFLIAGISGSKAADMAAVAPALIPEMQRKGSSDAELVSLLAASCAMSETIPPSLVLIVLAAITGISTKALFTAGMVPAIVLMVLLCILARYHARFDAVPDPPRLRWRQTARLFLFALPALVLPIIIRAAVTTGITTATEVSTIGIGYTLLVGALLYREGSAARLFELLKETASLTGTIVIVFGTASAMAWDLTQSGLSQSLADIITSLPGGSASFLAISIVAFVVVGSVLEGIPALVLFTPLLFPLARGLGIHEVRFGIVAILAMGLGLFAPPLGVGYYSACAISRIDPNVGLRRIWSYLGVLLVGVIIVAYIPWLTIGFLQP